MKKAFTLFLLAIAIFSTGFAQTCDTSFNLKSNLDTMAYYYAGNTPGAGYLSGNNEFSDAAKAEGFASVTGYYVTAASIDFAVVTISPTDSADTIYVKAWDNTGISNTGVSGAPGNTLDSIPITLAQIAQAVNSPTLQGKVFVDFTGNAVLTTDTFYAGVVLPTNPGDTVALYTNAAPPGPDGNGWDLTTVGWGSYNHDWTIDSGSLGNYIKAEICSYSTGINNLSDATTIKIYPNPASDQVNFQWNLNDEGDVVMYDATGKVVKTFIINGTGISSFDIHELASGAYIIRVTDRQTDEQHSSLFTKL